MKTTPRASESNQDPSQVDGRQGRAKHQHLLAFVRGRFTIRHNSAGGKSDSRMSAMRKRTELGTKDEVGDGASQDVA